MLRDLLLSLFFDFDLLMELENIFFVFEWPFKNYFCVIWLADRVRAY